LPPDLGKLVCYRLRAEAPAIVAGGSNRAWMDQTTDRFAYRCLPLTIANSMGWNIILPTRISAEWNGGTDPGDLVVEVDDPSWQDDALVHSHFGHGILTFHPGYLFRTDTGVAVWARGTPNQNKDGIAALDGIIETDWLDFSFTMNWQFTRPGRVTFDRGEPFCFITLLGYRSLESVKPQIIPVKKDKTVTARFREWQTARDDFNAGLLENDPATVEQQWQKWYTRGETPSGDKPNPLHLSKLKLAEPETIEIESVGEKNGIAPDAKRKDKTKP